MPASNALKTYASDRVYDGIRPLSQDRADKLRAKHRKSRPVARRFSIVTLVVTVSAVVVQMIRNQGHS